MVVNLHYRVDTKCIANDQRKITPELSKAVMVHVHDTSSYCALQLYEVSFK